MFEKIRLIISHSYPPVSRFENDAWKIIIAGSPIYNERMDADALAKTLMSEDPNSLAKHLNGSFLFCLFDKRRNTLTVVNDRSASIPFFYRIKEGIFTGATNYSDIWKNSRSGPSFSIDESAFYEFLAMRRLFGSKTYDRDTRFLDSASILTYVSGGPGTIEKYWQPDFQKGALNKAEMAENLALIMRRAFSRATSDGKRYGILLSGGLDSRTVLAASDKKLTCYTTCEYQNNEYRIARELSGLVGCEHVFVPKPKTYYSDIIEKASDIGFGMNIYANAHFFNMADTVKDKSDVLLHGYGFDFLFSGKYLPYTVHPALSGVTYKRWLVPLKKDPAAVADMFIRSLSFRLKSVDPLTLVKPACRSQMGDTLRGNIRQIIDKARQFSDDPYTWWDYCCFHNMSRHYTWLNLLSIRTFIEERTISFDNELIEFFWKMRPQERLNGAVFKEALRILDPRLFGVRLANSNRRLGDHEFLTSAKFIVTKALKKAGLGRMAMGSLQPVSRERSWPIDADLIRKNDKMKEITMGLRKSSALESLSFLCMDTISRCIDDHLEGRNDHTTLILTMMTIESFLKMNSGGGSVIKEAVYGSNTR